MCKRVAMMMAYVNAAYSMYNKKEVIFRANFFSYVNNGFSQ